MASTADGRPHRALAPAVRASWLPSDAVRRLAAYKLLAAYDSNQTGELAALTGNEAAVVRQFIRWYLHRPGADLPERPPAGPWSKSA
ncbi:hypothetical protein Sviol_44570 [Streptomyces violascens]|uniref:Uncharacterized protein n=2 Tax=Streptomyces violascens TaxID=67381 RepID=A0ABQ3QS23_9ACTN|nr:hypothetical protein Sviol_44570 [Streptomyces violascens]